MLKKEIGFLDFCSGIGAGRLGLESLGLTCLAHSEINTDSENTYNIFFKHSRNLGDLTKLQIKSIPHAKILIAGFPCQTFSIVGKRAGLEDERGRIIYHLCNILKQTKIPFFIFENVKGLVNHNKGKTLISILNMLDKAGYDVYYKVLNSIDYGVPQLRERVYFVGIKKDLPHKHYLFPKPKSHVSIKDFLLPNDKNIQDIENPTFKRYLSNKYNKGIIDIKELLRQDYLVIDTRQSDLRVYINKCPTLRAGRHGILYVRGGKLYKLSGPEALLLQGFPREYAMKAAKICTSKLLSQAGNAMTVPVIRAIGKSLFDCIGEDI